MSRKDKAAKEYMQKYWDRIENIRLSIMKDCGKHVNA